MYYVYTYVRTFIYNEVVSTVVHGCIRTYSEYSLICRDLFSKNMVDYRVWQINWIFIGTCTLYWYWETVVG